MHEEPNRSARESRDACALPEEEREKHEVVVIDPDLCVNHSMNNDSSVRFDFELNCEPIGEGQ